MKCLVAAVMAAIVLAPAGPAAADRLDEVKARGKLMVGVSDTTPPFSFKKPGESTVGYDLDLVHAVAKRLGVAVETVSVSSAERIPMLKDGKLDFVATSMTRTPERLQGYRFQLHLFRHAARRDRQEIERHHLGASAGRQEGLVGQHLDRRRQPEGGRAQASSWSMCATMRWPLACSRTARSTRSRPTRPCCARSCSRTASPDDYVFLSDFTKSRNVGFALKKDEPRFKDAINRALLDVEASGEAAKIFDAWFGPHSPGADAAQIQDPSRLNMTEQSCTRRSWPAARRHNRSGS